MKKRYIFIIILILLVVGFAALSTNLNILGNLNVEKSFAASITFDTNGIQNDNGNIEINETGHELTYTMTTPLTNIGDSGKFSFGIKNNSSLDAVVKSVKCAYEKESNSYYLSGNNDYVKLETIDELTNLQINSKSSSLDSGKKFTINYSLIQSYPDTARSDTNRYVCTFTVEPVSNN